MQTSYLQLEQEAAKLLKQAEELRLQERNAAIEEVKAKITTYGLTAADLGLTHTQAKNKHASAPTAAKYRGPNGELWGGGRGRKPDWVRAALAAGKSLDEFVLHNH